MFKVTLHIGELKDACLHNTLGRLDFGYSKLDVIADYKAELFSCGIGSHGLTYLKDYPRWSASIWDLIARLIARGLLRATAPPSVPSTKPTWLPSIAGTRPDCAGSSRGCAGAVTR